MYRGPGASALLFLTAIASFRAGRAEPATVNAEDLVRQAIDSERENRGRMVNYLFLESITRKSFNRHRELIGEQSSSFEVIFLEGKPAFRRVSINGRVLTEEEELAESARLRQLAYDRKKNPGIPSPAEERRRAHPFPLFLQYHELELSGSEQMDGRDCWVIQSRPRSRQKARSGDEQRVANATGRFWIDKETMHRVRMDVAATKAAKPAKIREETSYRWGQRDGSVWLITSIRTVLPISDSGDGLAYYEGEQTYSNYRRFSSESSVSLVPEE
ncbi:MAG: hypothetical protein H7039_04510 [Bryobacteraceae bacterium]|nr:hypothetical protein [Bryobacteraceae bacterium]